MNNPIIPILVRMRPIITTLCGSTRFPEAFALVNMHLTLLGRVVLNVGMLGHADQPQGSRFLCSDGDESTPEKKRLDELHFRKIDQSDGIFVINPGGYLGTSTMREIDYAMARGKTIEWLFDPALEGTVYPTPLDRLFEKDKLPTGPASGVMAGSSTGAASASGPTPSAESPMASPELSETHLNRGAAYATPSELVFLNFPKAGPRHG